jgi:hypothetical protein
MHAELQKQSTQEIAPTLTKQAYADASFARGKQQPSNGIQVFRTIRFHHASEDAPS